MTFPPPLDIRSIGLFRVLLGVVLLADLLFFRIAYLDAFYTDDGIVTRTLSEPVHRLGLWDVLTTGPAVTLFFGVTFVAYALFTIGYRARLFGFVSLCALWSIHQRSQLLIATDDQAIICLLFWSLFLPIDEQFTLFHRSDAPRQTSVAGLPAFAMLLQISIIYFLNAHPKTGVTWTSGVAISYALMEDLWAKPTAPWLAQWTEICRLLTYTIKPIEFVVPVLIFCPVANHITRLAAVLLILCFHWGIFLFISLGFFPLIASAWAAVIVPSLVWDRYLPMVTPRPLSDRERVRTSWLSSPSPAFVIGRGIGAVLLIGCLVIVVWTSASRVEALARYIPRLSLPGGLERSSLFRQNWALYAPDATIESKWIKVAGLRSEGVSLDTWSGWAFTYDSANVRAYQIEPWQNLAFHILYGSGDMASLADRWARYEYERWNVKHHDRPVEAVQLIAFSRTILAPGRTTRTAFDVIARYPPLQ